MSEENGFVIGGIRFVDEAQAKRADEEMKRIIALDANIDYENPRAVMSLYQKAQANRVFQTPAGIAYMLQLRDTLVRLGVGADTIPPIELPIANLPGKESGNGGGSIAAQTDGGQNNENALSAKLTAELARQEAASERHQKVYEARLEAQKQLSDRQINLIKKQWILIVALVFIILAMFVISMTSNNPTIINYRSKILNQYSEWEQELEEREAAISQKEQAAGAALEGSDTFRDSNEEGAGQ